MLLSIFFKLCPLFLFDIIYYYSFLPSLIYSMWVMRINWIWTYNLVFIIFYSEQYFVLVFTTKINTSWLTSIQIIMRNTWTNLGRVRQIFFGHLADRDMKVSAKIKKIGVSPKGFQKMIPLSVSIPDFC